MKWMEKANAKGVIIKYEGEPPHLALLASDFTALVKWPQRHFARQMFLTLMYLHDLHIYAHHAPYNMAS